MAVVPSPQQMAYQEMELIGFIHFTINTFTDKEWGDGSEDPALFAPADLDAGQWVDVAKRAGMKGLILTAKHHDGFCLWPSKLTRHSVASSPWSGGKGDVVRELSRACRAAGIKMGLYLSPWDRNHPEYARSGYLTYYRSQLRELLTGYGDVFEVWFDGANGGSGYYGGARENRTIDRASYYGWNETWALVKQLQSGAVIFSDAGPDVRWIGNEHGEAGETNWSTLNIDDIVVGAADRDYLNSGDPVGERWVVGECDVSIRPGWFFHADQGAKSPQQLVDIYYRSVGRNATLLLNIPPDRSGRFHERDVQNLLEFRSIIDETFAKDLAADADVTASHCFKGLAAHHIVDNDKSTYWAAARSRQNAALTVRLHQPVRFDRIALAEPIRLGQRIAAFEIEARIEGNWVRIARGTTIGYKRLLRIPETETDCLRLTISESRALPALSFFGLYKASPREATGE